MISFFDWTIIPYGCFSNFAPFGIIVTDPDGTTHKWDSVEAYYQAQKFVAPEYQEKIRLATPVRYAWKLGQSRTEPIHPDWETRRTEVMWRALCIKFTTHDYCKNILLGTGTEDIVEQTLNDYFWGCGKLGTGQNMLGKMLMALRTQLQTPAPPNMSVLPTVF
jgi:ribA/ribD-fused uncharacterized protein